MRLSLRWSRRFARLLPRRAIRYATRAMPQGAPRVLVLGIYVGDKRNTADHLVETFGKGGCCVVEQRWARLRGPTASPQVEAVTRLAYPGYKPKWIVLTELLELGPSDHDYVIFCDDDIEVGADFIDRFVALQQRFQFDLAQPARTWRSHSYWSVTRRVLFATARQTRFVEGGPVTSMSQRFLTLAMPFDEESPMGWGYDFVWSALAERNGLRIGVIDATPVDHSLRPPNALYGASDELKRMLDYLAKHEHTPADQVDETVRVFR